MDSIESFWKKTRKELKKKKKDKVNNRHANLLTAAIYDPFVVQSSVHLSPAFAGEWVNSKGDFIEKYNDFLKSLDKLLRKWLKKVCERFFESFFLFSFF
jgi:hypothetical protein